MPIVLTVLVLLFITVLSSLLSRLVRLPLPLLQIFLGVGAALLGMEVSFKPELFLLLFIPPLLFSDAYLTPKREFRELRGVIVMLALGLVIFTTIGCGYFIHWLVPGIPLSAAFALAAVLSPTDAVAVSGMLHGRPVPRRFIHILSGESLLNDASGLVCFKFAVAAALTGTFSLAGATGAFLLVSLGGLAVGAALAWLMGVAVRWLIARNLEDPASFAVLGALLPFASYLAAEELQVSGILAAVAAGLTISQMRAFHGTRTHTRLAGGAIWNAISFTFNGMIFLLLGLQLPSILRDGFHTASATGSSPWLLGGSIVLITVMLALLRVVWVGATLLSRMMMSRWRKVRDTTPSPRIIVAFGIAGVKGAVTLAAILSLPTAALDGAEFPGRELLVTLAAGVILCSLVMATVALPPLLAGTAMGDLDPMAKEVDGARLQLARVAVEAVERGNLLATTAAVQEEPDRVTDRETVSEAVLGDMRDRLARLSLIDGVADADEEEVRSRRAVLRRQRMEASMRLRIVRLQRDALTALRTSGQINDESERLLERELDYEEEVLRNAARLLPRPAEIAAGAPAGS
ncbi:Na+/H+ antiporter [Rhizosaccharibacter radicis]|uniref:Na+/H+ antiporter n=1 Tax=Rhizosaccharibacter radicis TaxID=2782605 RepID=A0ABT1VX05_9PROT|nr:Na+/H+ antiporter [Acetobacteraceae bacterium KSS12]